MLKVAISGADGKMGKMLIETVLGFENLELAAALAMADSPAVGSDAGVFCGKKTGVTVTAGTDALTEKQVQVLVDFTRPEGTMHYLEVCKAAGSAMVIGTTGFNAEQKAAIAEAAKIIPIVFAPNMSAGVNISLNILAHAAKLLSDYDCEIYEMHHNRKVDAPSGTAIEMGRVIAEARGQKLEDVAVWAREGHTGPRVKGSIGFAALRGGDVVGDHRVIFAGPGERIEIAHLSSSRQGYATGALKAAEFLGTAKPGLYSMSDVLGL